MGLDIAVYINLEPTQKPQPGEYSRDGKHIVCVSADEESVFPGVALPLAPGRYYLGELVNHFRIGSYSSYNEWRDWLCRFALDLTPDELWNDPYDVHDRRSFYQLINFSDCEGVIGRDACKKLALDFREHLPRLKAQFITDPESDRAKRIEAYSGEKNSCGWPLKIPMEYAKYVTMMESCKEAAEKDGCLVFC